MGTEMKYFYQLRHKPTGLFLKSSPKRYRLVAIGGNVYETKIRLDWFVHPGGWTYVEFDKNEPVVRVPASDFEIVCYQATEIYTVSENA